MMARHNRDKAESIRVVVGTIGRGTGKPFETSIRYAGHTGPVSCSIVGLLPILKG